MRLTAIMTVFFHYQAIRVPLKNRRILQQYIEQMLDNHGFAVEKIDYVFCRDAFLLDINRAFLKHNTLTDIITFDLSEKPKRLIAEIYISVERVKENAKKFGVTFDQELHRVIFHGILHLCGYNDKTASEKSIMRAKENEAMERYFKKIR